MVARHNVLVRSAFMEAVDQVQLNFNPATLALLNVLVTGAVVLL